MGRVVLISCVKRKRSIQCAARDLYTSDWFKKAFAFAQTLSPDKVYILSAKYHLVDLDLIISPYELTLNKMDSIQIQSWSATVLQQLKKVTDLANDHFILLAGEKYRKQIIEQMVNYEIPMKGLQQGKQLKWLKERLTSK